MQAHIFCAVVINRQVNGAERSPTNLLLDHVLIDAVDCGAISIGVGVLGARMERLLDLMRGGWLPTVVPQGAFVGRSRAVQMRESADGLSAAVRELGQLQVRDVGRARESPLEIGQAGRISLLGVRTCGRCRKVLRVACSLHECQQQ